MDLPEYSSEEVLREKLLQVVGFGKGWGGLVVEHGDSMRKNAKQYMDVSENSGTPKSSILIGFGFSIINHPFWDTTILGNPHITFDFTG